MIYDLIYFAHCPLDRSGQNPTGCTLSVERRKQIYQLAQRFDLVIIEDGMLSVP